MTVSTENESVKLQWYRSNAKINIDEFVEDYVIYRSSDQSDLTEDSLVELKLIINDNM
ncbi:MAG: hypothetical protein ACOC4G_07275 [Bacillota bacterium]